MIYLAGGSIRHPARCRQRTAESAAPNIAPFAPSTYCYAPAENVAEAMITARDEDSVVGCVDRAVYEALSINALGQRLFFRQGRVGAERRLLGWRCRAATGMRRVP